MLNLRSCWYIREACSPRYTNARSMPDDENLSTPIVNQRLQTNQPFDLPPFTGLHVLEKQLEPIAQRPHIGIHVFLELKRLRNDFYCPLLDLRVLASLKAEEKVASMLGVDAEIVDGTLRISLSVGGQPAL